jgi:hypothetical protein
MIRISKRFLERARVRLRRYQKLFESARSRDVNESDTVVITTDFLADVLGYDKYSEITTEFAIRSTFCDLAVKLDGDIRFLIEVKSVGTDLRENHFRQALDYAANQGAEYVVLTNGILWQVHRVKFDQPISSEEILSLDLLDPNARPAQLVTQLYLLSREAANTDDLEEHRKKREATSRYVVGQVLMTEPLLRAIRRELRGLAPDVNVTTEHLGDLLHNEVIKRDVLDGERAAAAAKLVKRLARRRAKRSETEDGDAAPKHNLKLVPVVAVPAAAAKPLAPAIASVVVDEPAP